MKKAMKKCRTCKFLSTPSFEDHLTWWNCTGGLEIGPVVNDPDSQGCLHWQAKKQPKRKPLEMPVWRPHG